MNKFLLLTVLACCTGSLQAQSGPVYLSLQEAIDRAQKESPSYYRAINLAENRYWNFRQYKASLLPQLTLAGTFPDYRSATDRITLDDGTFAFREREQFYWNSSLALQQNVPFTGGRLELVSGLQRTQVLRPVERTDYFSTPYSIRYIQPMLLYNRFRWDQKIEPLRYRESMRRYNENLEEVARETSRLYFDVLSAALQVKIARQNVDNNDTIYRISKGRYRLGKIAENALLQVELNLLNAQSQLTQAQVDYQIAQRALIRFLSYQGGTSLDLKVPREVPRFKVSLDKALTEARDNRAAVLEFRRRRLEAQEQVAQARGNTAYNVSLSANFGISRQATAFDAAYQGNFLPQQNLSLSVNIPLLDWGQAKAQVRKAQANRDLEQVNIQQEELNFEQEVFLQVMQFNIQDQQLKTAAKADTVARRRYQVAKARYLTGKIDITDLNIAQQEKDRARLQYLEALRNYWNAYYTLRRLTLYDFIANKPIEYTRDFER